MSKAKRLSGTAASVQRKLLKGSRGNLMASSILEVTQGDLEFPLGDLRDMKARWICDSYR